MLWSQEWTSWTSVLNHPGSWTMWREERRNILLQTEAVRTRHRSTQATTPIKASRIILSMVVTKGIEKERHCTASVVWRSMTTWNEKHETDKCWEEVKNILMVELVIDVPLTFVSENHGGACTPWNQFSFKWQRCRVEWDWMRSDGTFRHKDHVTNLTDVVRWRDDGKTQLEQRNEMGSTGIRMEVKQQTC